MIYLTQQQRTLLLVAAILVVTGLAVKGWRAYRGAPVVQEREFPDHASR